MKRFANVSIPSIKKIIHTSFEKQLLKSCSVRLFILIHFYANANTGITSPLDLEDLAQALDCNIKTVRSNILRLESCGFFDVSMDPVTEEYTFTIHDYTKMYNPIGLGGGYIQCTYDLLEQLLQIKSINELRVILMLLCEAITTELQSSAKLAVAKLTFKELLAGLPKYVKPGVVKQILDHANSFKTIFKEEYTRKKRYIAAKLNDCFNGATTKNQVRQETYSEIVSFTTEMDDVIRTFNTYLFEDKLRERMQYEEILKTEYGIAFDQTPTLDAEHLLPIYDFEETQYHDLTIMAQDYEIGTVLDALHLFYNRYILTKLARSIHHKGINPKSTNCISFASPASARMPISRSILYFHTRFLGNFFPIYCFSMCIFFSKI